MHIATKKALRSVADAPRWALLSGVGRVLVFTKYSFSWRLLCTNQPPFYSPRPPALPTLVQYHCTAVGEYTTPPPNSRVYAIHHTRLVITISCKGQDVSSLCSAAQNGVVYYASICVDLPISIDL